MRSLLAAAALLVATTVITQAHADETVIAATPQSWTQPGNIGLAEQAATQYHDSGRYLADFAAADRQATAWLESQAGHVEKPALVLDIDETALSNWDEQKANLFGFFTAGPCDTLPKGPCGFGAWERMAKAPALPPTLALFNRAKQLGIAVFFITGRNEDVRAATASNLEKAGYAGWTGLILEPVGSYYHSAADFKAPARARIEQQGYTILATVGDQRSDLSGGHAMRGFLLPNPYYFIP